MPGWIDVEVVETGFLPSAVLSLEEPKMLKAESFGLEAMLGNCALGMWKHGCLARTRGSCVSSLSLKTSLIPLPRLPE